MGTSGYRSQNLTVPRARHGPCAGAESARVNRTGNGDELA